MSTGLTGTVCKASDGTGWSKDPGDWWGYRLTRASLLWNYSIITGISVPRETYSTPLYKHLLFKVPMTYLLLDKTVIFGEYGIGISKAKYSSLSPERSRKYFSLSRRM